MLQTVTFEKRKEFEVNNNFSLETERFYQV